RLGRRRRGDGGGPSRPPPVGSSVPPRVDRHRPRPPPARQLPRPDGGAMRAVRRIDCAVGPEHAFAALYKESPSAFWLDSSSAANGGRFSFMGDASGPLGATIAYDVEAG